MKIQLLSDTHSNLDKFKPHKEVDLIIHAGDFTSRLDGINQIIDFTNICKKHEKPYVLVLGNHDYYSNTIEDTFKQLDNYDINYLKIGKEFKFQGWTFIGDTLFTEFNLPNYNNEFLLNNAHYYLSDFRFIKYNYSSIIVPQDYVKLFNEQWSWIESYRNKENVFVITHFLPSIKLEHPDYKNNYLNPYYMSNKDLTGFKHYACGHCLTHDTEILTNSGWKFRNQLNKNDLIYTLNKETEILELSKINQFFDYNYTGTLFEFVGWSINQKVTSNHNMIGKIKYDQNNWKFKSLKASELATRKSPYKFIRSGIYPNKGINLSNDLLSLYIAINADGSPTYNSENLIRFRLKKERKKEFIINLLNKLNISFKRYKYEDTSSSINFHLPKELLDWNLKGLDKKLLQCNSDQFQIILDTYKETDGSQACNSFRVYTSKKEEYMLLTHLSTICGYSSTTNIRQNHGFSKGISYQINFKKLKESIIGKPNLSCIKEEVKNTPVWCINVKNNNFFIRRNGKVSLTGNSHQTLRTNIDGCNIYMNAYGYTNGIQWECPEFDTNYVIEL